MASQGNTSPPPGPQEGALDGIFVVLRHECGPANGGAAASHWDLMIDLPGGEKLATWQVEIPPEKWWEHANLPAKRIDDHRKIYLTYEGEISNGRGHVKRVDQGRAAIFSQGKAWRVRLCGKIGEITLEIG